MNLLSFAVVYLIPASVVLGYLLGGGFTLSVYNKSLLAII